MYDTKNKLQTINKNKLISLFFLCLIELQNYLVIYSFVRHYLRKKNFEI